MGFLLWVHTTLGSTQAVGAGSFTGHTTARHGTSHDLVEKKSNATQGVAKGKFMLGAGDLPGFVLHSSGEDVNPPPNNAMTMLLGSGTCGGMLQSKCGCGWAGLCAPHKCTEQCKRWEECVGVVVHTEQERCWLIDARWPSNNFHTLSGPTRQIFVKGGYVTGDSGKALEQAQHFGQGDPGSFDAPDGHRYYWTISWIAAYFHPVENK